jgi:hypothetical protein
LGSKTRRDPSVASSFGEILNFLKTKNAIKFHWSMQWNLQRDLNLKAFMQFFLTPFFSLRKLMISQKLESTGGSRLISFGAQLYDQKIRLK